MEMHPIYNKENKIMNELLPFIGQKEQIRLYLDRIHQSLSRNIPNASIGEVSVSVGGIIIRMAIINEIKNNGHNLIKINDEEWEVDITKKTLDKLKIKDLKFAFTSGVVSYKNKDLYFAYLPKDVINSKYSNIIKNGSNPNSPAEINIFCISYYDNDKDQLIYFIIEDDKNIFDEISEENEELATIVLSTLIYCSIYKNNNSRVKIETQKVIKK